MENANLMLYKQETIARTDFDTDIIYRGYYKPVKAPKRELKKRVVPPPSSKYFLKDLHTINDHKPDYVPFNLYHTAKDVVKTNPGRLLHTAMPSGEEKDMASILKKRKRVLMPCGNSIDDVDNPKAREILIGTMYLASTRQTMEQGVKKGKNIKTPLPNKFTCANPIRLPKPVEPRYVSPEWRMETVTWDNKNLRIYCDPTQEFWLRWGAKKNRK